MALSLVVADNQNGSGGVATVAGSDGGTTNSLYAASFAGGPMAPLSWTLVGTRLGDGTISIASPGTLALGYYLFHLVGTVGGSAAFASYYRNLSDASAQAVADRVLDAFAQQIQALNLADVQAVNVVKRWLPRYLKDVDVTPRVTVAPVTSENFPGRLTGLDDVGNPVAVLYLDKQNQDYSANMKRNLLWRQKVSRTFRYQRLAGVPESVINLPDTGVIIDPGQFDQSNLFMGYQVFRAVTREPRGPASV